MSANLAAHWMVNRMRSSGGFLSHHTVVKHFRETSGSRHVYMAENGAYCIDKDVLRSFDRLTGNAVVWDRAGQYWRNRHPSDSPGRAQ